MELGTQGTETEQVDGSESPELQALLRTPSVLYHYTSAAGLKGILESGRMWASDIAFLNDERELRYGLEKLVSVVHSKVAALKDNATTKFILDQLVTGRVSVSPFVACFCEDGDLLSQWRGYGVGGGYALGFDPQPTSDGGESGSNTFRKVWYEPKIVEPLIEMWGEVGAHDFIECFSEWLDVPRGGLDPADTGANRDALVRAIADFDRHAYARMQAGCVLVKHPSFTEEREWRLVSGPVADATREQGVQFRADAMGLVPFLALDLRVDGGLLPLKEVIVGPGAHAVLRMRAVSSMLLELGYPPDSVDVRVSCIPYRT